MTQKRRRMLLGVAIPGLFLIAAVMCAQSQPMPPETVDLQTDITYATVDGQELKLDLARPKAAKDPLPIVVCIHGGGWQAGNKADFRQAMFGLAQAGYAAASVQYRLAPKHKFPAQLDDVTAAVHYLRDHAKQWNLDPDRLAAMGGSAGAHLALMLGTDPKLKLKAAVSLAGPTNLAATDLPKAATDILVVFLGGPLSEKEEAYRQASPITRVGPATSPILMVHGDKDELVPYTQSLTMRDACKKASIEVELVTIHDGTHGGGGTTEDRNAAIGKAFQFLRSHLVPAPK